MELKQHTKAKRAAYILLLYIVVITTMTICLGISNQKKAQEIRHLKTCSLEVVVCEHEEGYGEPPEITEFKKENW